MWENHLVLVSRGTDKTSYIPAFYQGLGPNEDQPLYKAQQYREHKTKNSKWNGETI